MIGVNPPRVSIIRQAPSFGVSWPLEISFSGGKFGWWGLQRPRVRPQWELLAHRRYVHRPGEGSASATEVDHRRDHRLGIAPCRKRPAGQRCLCARPGFSCAGIAGLVAYDCNGPDRRKNAGYVFALWAPLLHGDGDRIQTGHLPHSAAGPNVRRNGGKMTGPAQGGVISILCSYSDRVGVPARFISVPPEFSAPARRGSPLAHPSKKLAPTSREAAS